MFSFGRRFGSWFFFSLVCLFMSSGVAKHTRWRGMQVVVECGSFSRFLLYFNTS